MLTGDATNADPVCDKSPQHHLITDVIDKVGRIAAKKDEAPKPMVFRNPKTSKALTKDSEASGAGKPVVPV
jgi:pyrroloquinoline quinone biosynthesis protein E